jgi:Mg2+ and Co2+ transporter CorA
LIQAKKNRQEKVVLSKIDELLDAEFAEYQEKLDEQVDRMNAAIERSHGKALTEEENRELKKLYRTIVNALHPDIHPDWSEAKMQLFQNAVTAYENGDLNELRMIGAMVAEPVITDGKPDAMSRLIKERDRLTKLLQTVKDRIVAVKSEYPYTMKPIVQSREKTAEKKAEIEETIKQLNETLAVYTARIEQMLR